MIEGVDVGAGAPVVDSRGIVDSGNGRALLLGEVYAAGEAPIVAADGRSLARAVRVAGKVEPVFVEDIATMPQAILDVVRDGDVVLTMGAGSIGSVPGKLASA